MTKIHSSDITDILGGLEPISSLNASTVQRLASQCAIEKIDAGAAAFKAGESDNKCIYLVSGSLNLTLPDGTGARVLNADSQEAKYPVDDRQPHGVSAVAASPCELVRIDMDLLDKHIAEDQLTVCKTEVSEKPRKSAPGVAAGGFLSGILSRFTGGMRVSSKKIDVVSIINEFNPPMFKTILPEDLKKMCSRMEAISVKAGTDVIRQGDEGDYYYIIVSGTAEVTRLMEEGSEPVPLAELGPGETFGEEALLSNAKRNATVNMKTKGTLLRLAKRDFVELLKEPMLKWLSPAEAVESVKHGGKWLDVRSSTDFQRSHLGGAISMPLHELRDRIAELNKALTYVCCCDTGRLSCSAAFLLGQRGYRVGILRGGIQAIAAK